VTADGTASLSLVLSASALVMAPSSLPVDFLGLAPYQSVMSVLRGTGGVLVVRCLRCGHEAKLSARVLNGFGLKADAPISAFVKRLRCSECGGGSVMAKRTTQPIAGLDRRRRA
jgi:hypothetical protein